MVPASGAEGGGRDRLFGEEQRQDRISTEGVKRHAGAVTARVGCNGPNKARLKCGPPHYSFWYRQVSQVTTMRTPQAVGGKAADNRRPQGDISTLGPPHGLLQH